MTVRKWGGETLVNTNTLGDQSQEAIAVLDDGTYVIVWSSSDTTADGSFNALKLQHFSADGSRIGVETLVNSGAAGSQSVPSVVGLIDGGYLVAWEDNHNIEYRRFAAGGSQIDAADRTDINPANNQFVPDLAALTAGYAVAFEDDTGGNRNIRVQLLDTDGDPGALIDVAIGADTEFSPSVTGLTGGGFAVAWADVTTSHIRLRGFNAAGAQTFAAFDLSSTAVSFVLSATTLASGAIVVAWQNTAAVFPDGNQSVRARIVSSAGTPIGSEFTINTHTDGAQNTPDLAALGDGGFVAVYSSDGDIRGQVFDAFGARKGAEFVVNTSTDGGQESPRVAALADGRFVVTWNDQSTIHPDDASGSTRQQIFDPRDGVVTGSEAGETLFGHDLGNDEINGLGGADTLNGLGGSDSLYGGDGGDTYIVGAGDQVFEFSGGGTDLVRSSVSFALGANVENLTLTGAAANGIGNGLANLITGNAVANVLSGGIGGDTMLGLAGNDVYVVDNALDTVSEAGGSGIDTVVSSISFSLVASAHVVGAFENLVLTGTAAIGTGNGLANTITGNAVANTLSGAGGNDVLNGAAGNDRLFGGIGNDRLTGGLNNDIFVFNTAPSTTLNRDVITDFNHVADTIQLENAVFTRLGAGVHALNPAFFHAGATAADANDFIVYNQASGALFYDPNGSGAGGAIMFAVLANRPAIAANDFVVI